MTIELIETSARDVAVVVAGADAGPVEAGLQPATATSPNRSQGSERIGGP
jgi:hypothetical protein